MHIHTQVAPKFAPANIGTDRNLVMMDLLKKVRDTRREGGMRVESGALLSRVGSVAATSIMHGERMACCMCHPSRLDRS